LFGQKMAGLPHSHSAFDVQRLSFENVSVDSAPPGAFSKSGHRFCVRMRPDLRAGALSGRPTGAHSA
jgi:hypothetical protein